MTPEEALREWADKHMHPKGEAPSGLIRSIFFAGHAAGREQTLREAEAVLERVYEQSINDDGSGWHKAIKAVRGLDTSE